MDNLKTNINSLNRVTFGEILSLCSNKDLNNISLVCKQWNKWIKEVLPGLELFRHSSKIEESTEINDLKLKEKNVFKCITYLLRPTKIENRKEEDEYRFKIHVQSLKIACICYTAYIHLQIDPPEQIINYINLHKIATNNLFKEIKLSENSESLSEFLFTHDIFCTLGAHQQKYNDEISEESIFQKRIKITNTPKPKNITKVLSLLEVETCLPLNMLKGLKSTKSQENNFAFLIEKNIKENKFFNNDIELSSLYKLFSKKAELALSKNKTEELFSILESFIHYSFICNKITPLDIEEILEHFLFGLESSNEELFDKIKIELEKTCLKTKEKYKKKSSDFDTDQILPPPALPSMRSRIRNLRKK